MRYDRFSFQIRGEYVCLWKFDEKEVVMKIRTLLFLSFAFAAGALSLPHCSSGAKLPAANNFLEAVQLQTDATSFLRLIEGAGGLANVLGKEKYTLLVPQDAAFSQLGVDQLIALMAPDNSAKAASIVKSHVLLGTYSPEALAKLTTAPSLNGKAVAVSAANGLQVSGAKVVKSVKTKEGYVHFLDGILKD
jgi:uncharacterized surface protein with fasciclin (FAS1) repeats